MFTDDDCLVEPDWITNIVKAFDAEPDGDLLYGRVIAAGAGADDVALTPALDLEAPERLAKGEGYKVWGMGANFAARRRLFDRAGYFDEMLGGGGPLWSSQDYDLAYRTYKAGGVILLRPEVYVRHDGRREDEDWPKLLLAYGSGDGAFYMKHVRCLDPRATWLFAKQFGITTAKVVAKTVLRRARPRPVLPPGHGARAPGPASSTGWIGGRACMSSAEATSPGCCSGLAGRPRRSSASATRSCGSSSSSSASCRRTRSAGCACGCCA